MENATAGCSQLSLMAVGQQLHDSSSRAAAEWLAASSVAISAVAADGGLVAKTQTSSFFLEAQHEPDRVAG